MPIVAFFSKLSNLEFQNEWESRLQAYYPPINLVPLLSEQAKNAITALLWKAPLQCVKNLDNLTVVVLFNIEVSASSIVLETADALY